MNSSLRAVLSGILTAFALASAAAAPATAQKRRAPTAPTAQEAVREIFRNGDLPLAAVESCRSAGTSRRDRTLLDYLSGVLAFQTMPNSQNRLEYAVRRDETRRGEIVWICELTFYGRDDEDVWSNGVRFKMRGAGRRLIRSSIVCTGTG